MMQTLMKSQNFDYQMYYDFIAFESFAAAEKIPEDESAIQLKTLSSPPSLKDWYFYTHTRGPQVQQVLLIYPKKR